MNEAKGGVEGVESLEVFRRETPLKGTFEVPGDKSITHRALFLGALYNGRTIIRNPSPALDCRSTVDLLRSLGYQITEHPDRLEIDGSRRSSHPSQLTLDCGNSGTTARLAAGFLTGERGEFLLVGDDSLSGRPMERVAEPLRRIGGNVATTNGLFPVSVIAEGGIRKTGGEKEEGGENSPESIEVRSAQVETSLIIAAARSERSLRLARAKPMRDHTLRMAPLFGIEIERGGEADLVHPISGSSNSIADSIPIVRINVPGDVSSAAFLVAAALLVPGSDITITNVGLNPTRITFLETAQRMGGNVEWHVEENRPEPFGSIHVRYSPNLRGISVGAGGDLPVELMMDELPLLAFLGSQAEGETVVRGAGELRLKESDRIAATISLLGSLGIRVEEEEEGFRVIGPQPTVGGVRIDHHGDHRLAMLAGVAGLLADRPIIIPDPGIAAVSWPDVWNRFVLP